MCIDNEPLPICLSVIFLSLTLVRTNNLSRASSLFVDHSSAAPCIVATLAFSYNTIQYNIRLI